MGETQVLIEVVERAREALSKAQDAADNTKRPDNACQAHDCQFALSKALTNGIDTLLMLKLEEMHGGACLQSANVSPFKTLGCVPAAVATVSAIASALKPVAWPIAFICFSPNAVDLVQLIIAVFNK